MPFEDFRSTTEDLNRLRKLVWDLAHVGTPKEFRVRAGRDLGFWAQRQIRETVAFAREPGFARMPDITLGDENTTTRLLHGYWDLENDFHVLFLVLDSTRPERTGWIAINGEEQIGLLTNVNASDEARSRLNTLKLKAVDWHPEKIIRHMVWTAAVFEAVCAHPYAMGPNMLADYVKTFARTFAMHEPLVRGHLEVLL